MPLNKKTAARIAKEHGLSLPDAQALAVMADTEDEADELAAQFAPQQTPEDLATALRDRIEGRA